MADVGSDWWRAAVMYQVYPRSYADSNGDGVGDLNGITQKIPYIASLGVDGIWLSPFMRSPMKDFGYDVSSYRDVDPLFGTLDHFKELLDTAHKHNIKVIIDLVLSHTSDQHPWFKESRSSKDNAKHDWYVWADAKDDGSPPNNWLSLFGGSSWQWDTRRCQYYLHNFLKCQPDLNCQNKEVQDMLLEEAKFWLDMGIDGFRLDVANFYMCDLKLQDNPPRPKSMGFDPAVPNNNPYNFQLHLHDKSQPENLLFIARFRSLMNQYKAIMTVAEIGDDGGTKTQAEYVAGTDRLHTAYSFELMRNELDTSNIRKAVEVFFEQPGNPWPAWAFSNHDFPRVVSRWGQAEPELGKVLLAMLCTLKGTVFMYQGEELALPEVNIPFELLQDPYGIEMWPEFKGRDGCRTPMPWDNTEPHCGFIRGGSVGGAKPWLPIVEEHQQRAVNIQETNPDSMLNFTRKFLAFRNTHRATLGFGDIQFYDSPSTNVLAFSRSSPAEKFLLIFNCGKEAVQMPLPQGVEVSQVVTESGLTMGSVSDGVLSLPGFSSYVALLK